MADDNMEPVINYDCLEYLFQFLTPVEWVQFAQGKQLKMNSILKYYQSFLRLIHFFVPVCIDCKKIATSNKDSHEFTFMAYYCGYDKEVSIKPDKRQVSFPEFLEIFKLVVPKLKSVKLQRNRDIKARISMVSVFFGRFEYYMILNKSEQEKLMMQIFLTQTKNVQNLETNAFGGETVLEWQQFFQTNPVEYVKFYPTASSQDSDDFFDDYISILPSSLDKIHFCFGDHWLSDEEEQKLANV